MRAQRLQVGSLVEVGGPGSHEPGDAQDEQPDDHALRSALTQRPSLVRELAIALSSLASALWSYGSNEAAIAAITEATLFMEALTLHAPQLAQERDRLRDVMHAMHQTNRSTSDET